MSTKFCFYGVVVLVHSSIGERLKTLRKQQLNLTQKVFADILGIDRSHVGNIEKDLKKPSDSLVKHICLRFGVSEAWLKEGVGDIFLSPEETLKKQMALIGERAFLEAVNVIMKEHGLAVATGRHPHRADTSDPRLDRLINTLYDLWATGDENIKGWATIQFDRAIPADVVEEAQKKHTENYRRQSASEVS